MLHLLVLAIARPDLRLLPLTLLGQLFIPLFQFVTLPAKFNWFSLLTLIVLSQLLEVNEHALIILAKFLNGLLFNGTIVFQWSYFLILLLDHNWHGLRLSLEVHQCLFSVFEFHSYGALHITVIFHHLGKFHFCIDFLLLHLVLQLLFALSSLIECDFLLQGAVLHLLIFQK